MSRPPPHDLAHLAYLELLTPEFERSVWFFTEILRLTLVSAEDDTAYLRTWDDYERHTLKLTGHRTSGIARIGLRAESQEALERRVKAVEASGLGIGWKDGDPGIGPTYACYDPDGHVMELYYESEWYADSRPAEHHIAFKTDTREDILRAADIALDKGVFIETGPHKHAIQQTFFLYLYEPGGNRIELGDSTGRLIQPRGQSDMAATSTGCAGRG